MVRPRKKKTNKLDPAFTLNPIQAQDLVFKHMAYDREQYKLIPTAEQSGAKSGFEFMKAGDRKAKAFNDLKAKYAAYGYVFQIERDSIAERF